MLVFYVIGYRKKVVLENLRMVFPDKPESELLELRKKFYRHMCDMFLEMIRVMGISKKELQERYQIKNIQVIRDLLEERSVISLLSHYGNWEWSAVVNHYIEQQAFGVYQRINNPYFDRLVRSIRERWDAVPIHQRETVRTMVKNERQGVRGLYGMLSDQSPMKHLARYWKEFMGIEVPIFDGPENLARKLDLAVVFAKVTKVKRGYYEVEFITISNASKNSPERQITDTYLELVEQQVKEDPAYYLWTHRRWKHRSK